MSTFISRRTGNSGRGSFKPEELESRTLLSAWSPVDDFQLAAGKDSRSGAVAVDVAGNVYAAGNGIDSAGVTHGIVREMASGSSTWTTIENLTANRNAAFYAAVTDAAGDLYVAGTAQDSAGNSRPIVLEHPVGGSFTVVDWAAQPGLYNGLAIDAGGNVYAAGETSTTAKNGKVTYYWTVRKQTGGHGTFATVDNLASSGGFVGNAYSVTSVSIGAGAGIYVAGSSPTGGAWFVRKSVDAGGTWSTVDNFQYDASGNSGAFGVAGDGAGNVYVVGRGFKGTANHWLVRKSGNGGASWSTDDDFQLSTSNSSNAYTVGTDLAGSVYVLGNGPDSGGTYHNLTRTNSGGTWTTVDDVVTGKRSDFMGFAAGPDGTLYSSMGVYDSGGAKHWTVRSAAGPTGTLYASATSTAAVFSLTLVSAGDDSTDLFHQWRHRG